MAWYHWCRRLWLFYVGFHNCHLPYEFNHLFWSPIQLVLILSNILRHILTSSMNLYHRRSCYFLFFIIVVTYLMIATSRLITDSIWSTFWKYTQFLFFSQWCFITVAMVFCCFLLYSIVVTSRISATKCFDQWFYW